MALAMSIDEAAGFITEKPHEVLARIGVGAV